MVNIHPILAHFPFVLLFVAVAAEIWGMLVNPAASRFSRVVVMIACAASALTYLSGYVGLEYANQSFEVPKDAISHHQLMGKLYLLSLVPTALFALLQIDNEARFVVNAGRLFLFLSFALVVVTSFYGGELVFSYGAGVLIQQ
jgi:uncharacterized membrane protein